MSLESITPLPASSSHEPAEKPPVPDLTTLRQGWDEHRQTADSAMADLPSLPASKPDLTSEAKPQNTADDIPALPKPEPPAAQSEFTMDALDSLLASVYPEQAKKSPGLQSSGGVESLPAVPTPAHSEPRARTEKPIPLMEIPSPGAQTGKTENQTIPALDAMPNTAAPDVSLPLARDQFVFPRETKPGEPTVEHTAPSAPAPPQVTFPKTPAEKPDAATPAERKPEAKPQQPRPAAPKADRTRPPAAPAAAERPDYTDEDLREALRPIIDQSVDKFLYTPNHGIHTYLEPMLRSTVRRAIAEQMDDVSPFREAAGWDKFAWKMRALFSSRTYEEVLFEHTKRYQVEEVFLLRCHTRSLISYASNNPARHAAASKVQSTVKKIASKCSGNSSGESDTCIKWEENRHLMLRRGKHCILAAIVNGSSNAILRSDLDYALRQAEERFGKSLEEENDIHLQILQPLLEGCLLIKAPAIPN